jgi:multidrug efflux pump subunit AcrA (membrane-fusion protein)
MTPDTALLTALLDLLPAARAAGSEAERRFVLLNRSRDVLPYFAAVLCGADGQLLGHSGVSSVDAQGPYGLWLRRLAQALVDQPAGPVAPESLDAALVSEGADWWPPYRLWLPAEGAGGGLLLARDLPWTEAEQQALAQWFSVWRVVDEAAATQGRRRLIDLGALWQAPRPGARRGWRKPGRWIVLALLLATLLPVPLTLRAPGELVPREPTVMRAALEATVRRLAVEPNQSVEAGQVLAEFDDAANASRLQVARQAVATATAEWRQTSQQALGDPRAKAQLPLAQGKLEQAQTELRYLQQQMQRNSLVAPHAGVVLVDDPGSWAGRTVQAGEALLRIAQPQDQELEAWLAVGDAIELPEGSAMHLYLASRPAEPVDATLRLYAYEAEARPDGSLAYRLRGQLSGAPTERLGARGTVRIEGPRAPLAYVVLRRPLAALREMTGW